MNPDIEYLAELLKREGFYNLTGTDGCLCAHLRLRYIDFDVHCYKSNHFLENRTHCDCPYYGVHITPVEPMAESELLKLGEIIKDELGKMVDVSNVKVVIHKAHNQFMYEKEGW